MRKKNRYSFDRFNNAGQLQKYKNFKKRILFRDGYCCRWPGCKANTDLEMHHLAPWSKYPHLRYVDSNCIILCKIHHAAVFNKEEQYVPFFQKLIGIAPNASYFNGTYKSKYQGKYKYKKGPSKRKPQRKPKGPNNS